MVLLLLHNRVDVVDWTWLAVTLHIVDVLMILGSVVTFLGHHVLLLNDSHHSCRCIVESLLIDKVWSRHTVMAITTW